MVIVLRRESGRFIGEYPDGNRGFKLATLFFNTLLIYVRQSVHILIRNKFLLIYTTSYVYMI